MKKIRKVLTYGTFDLFHIGHLRILERAKKCGDYLVVGVSSDRFNQIKGKTSYYNENDRMEIVKSLKCVNEVFLEENWEQKIQDIQKYDIDVFVMGNDWYGKFDDLKSYCEVKYLERTDGISTTKIKDDLGKSMFKSK